MSATGAQTERPRPGWRIAAVLGAIYALFVLAQDLDWLLTDLAVTAHGDYGAVGVHGPRMAVNQLHVVAVRPGTSAAALGLASGDEIFAHERFGVARVPAPGDRLAATVVHDGRSREVALIATESRALLQPFDRIGEVFAVLADAPAALLAFFVLVRSRGRRTPVLLGIALASFALANGQPGPFFSWAPSVPLMAFVNGLSGALQYSAFLAFGLSVLDSADGRGRAWRWRFVAAYAAAFAGVAVVGILLPILGVDPGRGARGLAADWGRLLALSSLAVTLGLLLLGWRRAIPMERQRFALLVAAFCGIIANQMWILVIYSLYLEAGAAHFGDPPMLIADVLSGVVAPSLFAYAILRHRVLDLGFALNRTLVYSVVSAILVGAFALSEWAIDHFVKIQGRETNALIDAGIALAVSLTFHKVRAFVEHAIELLFFRSWQEEAAALRKFVAEAGFVTRREPLIRGLGGALNRFADADCAIYLLSDNGDYRLADGALSDRALAGAPKRIDPDDPALVTLRADHRPLNLADSLSVLPAELAAPMINRNEVTGLVLMGAKAAAAGYRPDEAELIGWAVTQVGLDLHALEVEQLQAAVGRLEHQLEGARLAAQKV